MPLRTSARGTTEKPCRTTDNRAREGDGKGESGAEGEDEAGANSAEAEGKREEEEKGEGEEEEEKVEDPSLFAGYDDGDVDLLRSLNLSVPSKRLAQTEESADAELLAWAAGTG